MAEELVPQKHGGSLKRGNTKNTGSTPKDVRAKYLRTADRGHRQIDAMISWKACMPVPGRAGAKPGMRIPTFEEWKWACEVAVRYGLGVRQDVDVTSDGQPVRSVNLMMLDSLTEEELNARLAAAEAREAS